MAKAIKAIGIIKNLSKICPQHFLITLNILFVRPHLDNGDIRYHQTNSEHICQNIGSVQFNAGIGITSAIKGTS